MCRIALHISSPCFLFRMFSPVKNRQRSSCVANNSLWSCRKENWNFKGSLTKKCQTTICTAFSKSWFYLRLFRLRIRESLTLQNFWLPCYICLKQGGKRHQIGTGRAKRTRGWRLEIRTPSKKKNKPTIVKHPGTSEAKYVTAELSFYYAGKERFLGLTFYSTNIYLLLWTRC